MNNLCHAVTEITPPLYPLHRSVSLQFSCAFVLTPQCRFCVFACILLYKHSAKNAALFVVF